ncbi:hypothetical protein ABG768_003520 [Culter alburnus]|uniref:non-specific serine/threonine protein kinase n=1 Tax=Culter alburnus TaxID=194366 RepID=A0AAW2A017_CULAL
MKRVNAALACPNIIQLVKWFDRPTQYIMILERQDPCQDLSTFCAENGHLDESLAKKVLLQLLSALKHCKSRGVLHRDIKPDNLLFCTATHDTKLLSQNLPKDSAYTAFTGTFTPPEWYHYGQYHAEPATVWSVGVTLYNILCGSYPFRTRKVTFKTRLRFTRDLQNSCLNQVKMCLTETSMFYLTECCQLIIWCLSAEAEDHPSLQDIEQHPWLQSAGGQ